MKQSWRSSGFTYRKCEICQWSQGLSAESSSALKRKYAVNQALIGHIECGTSSIHMCFASSTIIKLIARGWFLATVDDKNVGARRPRGKRSAFRHSPAAAASITTVPGLLDINSCKYFNCCCWSKTHVYRWGSTFNVLYKYLIIGSFSLEHASTMRAKSLTSLAKFTFRTFEFAWP